MDLSMLLSIELKQWKVPAALAPRMVMVWEFRKTFNLLRAWMPDSSTRLPRLGRRPTRYHLQQGRR